jgi:hypothetical protein
MGPSCTRTQPSYRLHERTEGSPIIYVWFFCLMLVQKPNSREMKKNKIIFKNTIPFKVKCLDFSSSHSSKQLFKNIIKRPD